MRFLVDESTGPVFARWLSQKGYQVFSVYDQARGLDDELIIEKALAENWVLITNDKDFGEKVYRNHHAHRGVILVRLEDERAARKIVTLQNLLERYSDKLVDQYIVVTEKRVRFARH